MFEKDYILVEIDGDYAVLRDADGGEIFIAMALLPIGADINSKIHYENFEYSLI